MKTVFEIITLAILVVVAVFLYNIVHTLRPLGRSASPVPQNGGNAVPTYVVTVSPSPMASTTDDGAMSSTSLEDMIVVDSPQPGQNVSSPLVINGRARGNWYFEAVFPVVLTDWDGRIIAEGQARAQGDWMTSDFVPFEATLDFAAPKCAADYCRRGTLILKRDNPSGDPSRDKTVEVPVIFK